MILLISIELNVRISMKVGSMHSYAYYMKINIVHVYVFTLVLFKNLRKLLAKFHLSLEFK